MSAQLRQRLWGWAFYTWRVDASTRQRHLGLLRTCLAEAHRLSLASSFARFRAVATRRGRSKLTKLWLTESRTLWRANAFGRLRAYAEARRAVERRMAALLCSIKNRLCGTAIEWWQQTAAGGRRKSTAVAYGQAWLQERAAAFAFRHWALVGRGLALLRRTIDAFTERERLAELRGGMGQWRSAVRLLAVARRLERIGREGHAELTENLLREVPTTPLPRYPPISTYLR